MVLQIPADEHSFARFLAQAGYFEETADVLEVRVRAGDAKGTNAMVSWNAKKKAVIITGCGSR